MEQEHQQPEQQKTVLLVNRKKPIVTYTLIGICVLIFALDYLLALYFAWKYDINVRLLASLGVKSNELIVQGQVWRLITAVFLHGSATHIGFNMLALYSVGRPVETLYGRKNYVFIFLIAGLMGTAASFAFTSANSLGASGAIFGLLGALLYLRSFNKEIFSKIFGTQLFVILGINLVLGFVLAYIDNFGHIGGLIGGYLAAGAFGLLTQKNMIRNERKLFIIGLVILFIALMTIGVIRQLVI